MAYTYLNDSVNVVLTAVGALLPATSVGTGVTALGKAGRMFASSLNTGLLCLNAAVPAGSTIRSGWAMSPNLQWVVTKAAISPSDRVLNRGRAFTLDGRAYCSTPALAVAVARTIDRLPYTADGALKINEK